MTEWYVPNEKENLAQCATVIMYDAVLRALEDPNKIFEDPKRALEEGLNTVEKILSKVSRGTRKELKKNVVNPYKQKHSFD